MLRHSVDQLGYFRDVSKTCAFFAHRGVAEPWLGNDGYRRIYDAVSFNIFSTGYHGPTI